MLTADLMTDEIPPLKTSDSAEMALRWMEEFKVNHLAVVDGKELKGLVAESDILDANLQEEDLSSSKIRLLKPVIHQTQHAFDALKLMTHLNLSLLPVLDEQEHYAGSITQRSIVEKMSGITAVSEPGGIIELEMNKNDYSLTQIASIVEGNEAKILSVLVGNSDDPNKIEVTLKINREDLTRILQTFYRYNYVVKGTYHQSEFDDDIKNRLNEFLRFLNI
jgi:predicted transcriptional regulator